MMIFLIRKLNVIVVGVTFSGKTIVLYHLSQIFPVQTNICHRYLDCEKLYLMSENCDGSSCVSEVTFDEFERKLSSTTPIQHQRSNEDSVIDKSIN
jgi:hypothetical protein